MSIAVDTKKGRYYPWKQDKYVSVTTAISDGLPKPGLNRWFQKNIAHKAVREVDLIASLPPDDAVDYLMKPEGGMNAAAILGTSVHALAERISKGETVENFSIEQKPFVDAFLEFMIAYQPTFIETEATVFSRTYGYAGTMDTVVEIGGNRYVMDYKTGKSVWPEAALQISAYRYAEFIGRPNGEEDEMPTCDGGLVLHLRPSGYEVLPVDTSLPVFETFLSTLDIFRWLKIDSESAIGERW